jgi:predicted alpha/beta superfamily hydrolase
MCIFGMKVFLHPLLPQGPFPRDVHFRVICNRTTEMGGGDLVVRFESDASKVEVHSYPFFAAMPDPSTPDGQPTYPTRTLSFSVTSPYNNFTRTITTVVPPSLTENCVARRRANYLVILDGSPSLMASLAHVLSASIAAGDVPSNTIMVGVPAAAGSLPRLLDFTPTPCDPFLMAKCEGPSGDGGRLLDFLEAVVIPEAERQAGFLHHEVAIAGFSLGGLVACWAAGVRSAVFQRASCHSPSNWWNNNDLVRAIAHSSALPGYQAPKAVVLYMGGGEGSFCWNKLYRDYQNATCTAWLDQYGQLYTTLLGAGLVTNKTLFAFTNTLNQHTAGSWNMILPTMLRAMYADGFPSDHQSFQVQASSPTQLYAIPEAYAPPAPSPPTPATRSSLYLYLLLSLFLLSFFANCVFWYKSRLRALEKDEQGGGSLGKYTTVDPEVNINNEEVPLGFHSLDE